MNLLRQYLHTCNFAYCIFAGNHLVERDKDNLLADSFDVNQFVIDNKKPRLISFYRMRQRKVYVAIINWHDFNYVVGPVIIDNIHKKNLTYDYPTLLVSNAHLKHLSQNQFINIINLSIRMLGAYVNPKKVKFRFLHPIFTKFPLNNDYFVRLNNNGAHVNYAFEKQLNNAILAGDSKSVRDSLRSLYQSGRIGILSSKGKLRNIIDFGIIVISTNIRVALRNGMDFELAYSLNDYYVRRLESQTTVHAVIKCIEDNCIDLAKQIEHDITKGMPPVIVYAYHLLISNPKKKITSKQVAGKLNMSPNYFSNLFKQKMGISFTQLRNLIKINHSIAWLASSNISISEVADMLNFSDQAYFSNQFKKFTSYTPNQVRHNPKLVSDWSIYAFLENATKRK